MAWGMIFYAFWSFINFLACQSTVMPWSSPDYFFELFKYIKWDQAIVATRHYHPYPYDHYHHRRCRRRFFPFFCQSSIISITYRDNMHLIPLLDKKGFCSFFWNHLHKIHKKAIHWWSPRPENIHTYLISVKYTYQRVICVLFCVCRGI